MRTPQRSSLTGLALTALALGALPAGCGSGWKEAGRVVAIEHRSPEALLERRRDYYDVETGRLRAEWTVLILPGGTVVKHGKETIFFPDGRPEIEREFFEGEPSGRWRTWYTGGQIRSDAWFDDQLKPMSWWYEDGQLSSEGTARTGVKEGRWRFWYPSGILREEGAFRAGKRHGRWSYWYEDGTLAERGDYQADTRVGYWDHPAEGQGERQDVAEGGDEDDASEGKPQ